MTPLNSVVRYYIDVSKTGWTSYLGWSKSDKHSNAVTC